MNLKEIRNQIKQSMDRDKAKAILEHLGYEVSRSYTFKLREERTPSASIRRDGYIKDFGSGWGGDIVALLHEHHGITLNEATHKIAEIIGITENSSSSVQISTPKREASYKEEKLLTHEEIVSVWNKLTPLSSPLLDEEKKKELIERIVPCSFFKTATLDNRSAFVHSTKYNSVNDDIVVKLFDDSRYALLTLKYRTKKGMNGKWIALKGTKANANAQICIKTPNKPIFVIEGTHDYLTAHILGINFIALPYKHYRGFTDKEIDYLKSIKPFTKIDLIFLPDRDGGNIAEETIAALCQQLNTHNLLDTLQVWDIHKRFTWTREHPKADFSDAVAMSPYRSTQDFVKYLEAESTK